jgi:hypothetical protein
VQELIRIPQEDEEELPEEVVGGHEKDEYLYLF